MCMKLYYINLSMTSTSTYDHRIMKTRLPVRSALFKHDTGGLVVKWVTISESLLLYVFAFLNFFETHHRYPIRPFPGS
jgi:hypothetical protein